MSRGTAVDMSPFVGARCLITGGLGFLGSNLAVRLAEAGAKVTLIDSMLPEYGGNLANIEPVLDDVTVNFSDVRDRGSMNFLVRGQDFIFHMAGQVSHVMSLTDPFPDIDINIGGTTTLLESVRANNPDARIVFASTRGAYGPATALPVNEDQPMQPIALHEISKLSAELIFKAYAKQYGIRSTLLRYTNTYGPRSQMQHGRYGVVNYFLRLAMDGSTIDVFGDGSTMRDYLYVDDAIDATLLAALATADSEDSRAYNVGRPEPTTLLELVQAVIDAAGSGDWRMTPFSEERKAQEPGHFYSDIARIQTELGWSPTTALADGLTRTVSYYEPRRSAYWDQSASVVAT